MSLNPRLMAGKPPACKVGAAALQETELCPRDRKWRKPMDVLDLLYHRPMLARCLAGSWQNKTAAREGGRLRQ